MRSAQHVVCCSTMSEPPVSDLGGHLDTTCRARASTMVSRVRKLTVAVHAVGALSVSFSQFNWSAWD